MIAVLQRVQNSSVSIDGIEEGKCAHGLMILLGVAKGDNEEDARLLAAKISKLRIFCDEKGKMNLSVKDVDGEVLVVSQFTLLANYKKGNRPDYFNSAPPNEANRLYNLFIDELSLRIGKCECGVFGADMRTEMSTDGPVTIIMDSLILRK